MWPNPLETADLVTFTEEILNKKFRFLWSEYPASAKSRVYEMRRKTRNMEP